MTFRINAKNFFLTYPHCSLDLEKFIHSSDKYIIAREKHQDGDSHVHCYLHYEVKKNIRDPKYFDVEGHHGNYMSCRNPNNVIAYVKKDGEYITNFSEEELKKCNVKSKREALAEALIEEKRITKKLIMEHPEVIFLNFDSVNKWLAQIQKFDNQSQPSPPQNKRRHIWIYGPSNSGKTTWLRQFKGDKRSTEIPTNNDWKEADEAEFLWADEYKGHLSVQFLNRLCDGDVKLNTKGGSIHIWYPKLIILSNYSMRECYSKVEDSIMDTLHNRFMEYEAPNELLTINLNL